MKRVHGLKIDHITKKIPPNNGLPDFVKDAAAERGYGDSLDPLSLYVTEADINNAFACRGQGDGTKCVMAQAAERLGAKRFYFFRTTAWVDFGEGPILRFVTPNIIYKNVIAPFDRGDRQATVAGMYLLKPPCNSQSLRRRRQYDKTGRKLAKRQPSKAISLRHLDRLVLARYV